MSNFSIKHPLFIVPFENVAEGRAEIEFFMSLLADSGIDCYFSDWKKKTEKAGRPECDPYMMFAAALLSFSLDGGRLREIESKCRYDIRFLYFMTKDKPSYATFCNLLNKCVLPNADAIFSRITATICRRMGIDPNSEVFVDGTKVEANANKYKFVWKPDRKMDRLLEKAESECAALGIHADGGIVGHVGRMTALVGLLEEKLASQKIDISSIQSGKGIRNPAEVKTYLRCLGHLRKMAVYQEQVEICGKNRNSYYKTDHDATAMCLKEDYYSGLGSKMHAGYKGRECNESSVERNHCLILCFTAAFGLQDVSNSDGKAQVDERFLPCISLCRCGIRRSIELCRPQRKEHTELCEDLHMGRRDFRKASGFVQTRG